MTDTTPQKGIYVRQTYGYIYSGDLVSKAESAVTEVTALAKQVSDKTDIVIEKAGEVDANTTTAQNAADKACAWATQLDTPVEDGEYSSKYWALQAASIQADWTENDTTKSSYIQHKPTLVSNLSDLTDVSVSGVTDGESLVYDSVNTVWQGGGVKANASLDNLTTVGRTVGASFSMPSSTYENLTFGASGDTYTAPANGWYVAERITTSSSNNFLNIKNTTSELGLQFPSISISNAGVIVYVPACKNDVIQIKYGSNTTASYLKFIYSEGEV